MSGIIGLRESRGSGLINGGQVSALDTTGTPQFTAVKTAGIQSGTGTASFEITAGTGDLGFANTDVKIKLPSAGGIYKGASDTAILTESGGAVTLDNVALGGSVTGAGLTGWGANGANNDLLPESASAGIYLGVSSAVAANLLDDYEEGTWDAVVTDGSTDMAMDGSYDTGYYTKVGNLVTVSGYFATTSLGSASGNIRITGLPFTVAPEPFYSGGGAAYGTNYAITAAGSVSYRAVPDGTYVSLFVWDRTLGTSGMQASEWTATGKIIIGFSYKAA